MGVYSNEAAAYAATKNNVSVNETLNPIQYAIDSYRSDLQLFEALIEVDVCNAMNECGIVSIDEATTVLVEDAAKTGIIEKIKELLDRFIGWCKSVLSKFQDAIIKIAKADKAIWKRYEKFAVWDKVKTCPAKGATFDYFEASNIKKTRDDLKTQKMDETKKVLDSVFKASEESYSMNTNLEDVNESAEKSKVLFDEFNEGMNGVSKTMKEKLKDTTDKPVAEKLTADNFKKMVDDIKNGYKETLKVVSEDLKKAIKEAEDIKKDISRAKKQEDKDSIKILNIANTIATRFINMNKSFKDSVMFEARMRIGLQRANFLVLCNWAAKNDGVDPNVVDGEFKEVPAVESAELIEENFILEECSNMLVEEAFSFV